MASFWRVLTVFIYVIVLCKNGYCDREDGDDDSLVSTLLRDYNKLVAPVEPLTLKYEIWPVKLVDVDSQRGILTVDLWLKNEWIDPRLSWDPEEHSDEGPVFFRRKHLFVPEVELYNGRATSIIAEPNVVAYSNGGMFYFPTVRAEIYCELPEPPFKDTLCPIRIGPWAHDARQTILENTNPVVEHGFLVNTGSCSIGTSAAAIESSSYVCCPGLAYDSIVLELNVSCSDGHVNTASPSEALKMKPSEGDVDKQPRSTPCFLPLIATPFFVLFVFLLPPKATERIFLGIIVFVALLLIWTSGSIPTDIDGFLQLSAGMIIAATLASLVSCKLNANDHVPLATIVDNEHKAFGCKSRLGAMVDLMLFAAVAIVLGIATAGTFA